MSGARWVASLPSPRDVSPPNLAALFGAPSFCLPAATDIALVLTHRGNVHGGSIAGAHTRSRGGQRARSDRRRAGDLPAARFHDDATRLSHSRFNEPSGDLRDRVSRIDRGRAWRDA